MLDVLSFNRIQALGSEGEILHYTPEQFIQLPVKNRISMVLGRKVHFFQNRTEVDRSKALNDLRRWSADQA